MLELGMSGLQIYQPDEQGASPGILSSVQDMVIAPLLIFAFSLITSGFVMFVVDERVCRFLHQVL